MYIYILIIMGITNFNKWIKEMHPVAILDFNINTSLKYDCVYIDMNHILHYCLANCTTFGQFADKICKRLDFFVNLLDTLKIVIVIDGPAPYPKLMLQRKRRKDNSDIIKTNIDLSPYGLTPGTTLIKKIEKVILNKLNEIKTNNKYLNIQFETSFSNVPGEGEIKINKYLCDIKTKQTILIIGNDADITVLSMSKIIPDVYVYNNSKTIELINVKKIKTRNVFDFVFSSLLLGNDYLPKLLYTNYNHIWDTCEEYTMYNSIINYENMVKNKYIEKYDILSLFTFMYFLNKKVKPSYSKFILKKYDEKHVKNYIDGILWSLYLYLDGNCSKYDYIYQYENSPTIPNIMHYLLKITKHNVPVSNIIPIDHKIYTVFTLPYSYINLVPKEYHNIVKKINQDKEYDINSIRLLFN